ncbi:hypothetical protein Godav_024560, partial [Gossypium davidsonii]|nr:hypothetical protein [Gossypium davidsonii]
RQAFVPSPRPILESSLQLLHVWKGRFGAYDRKICGFTPMFKVSSGQGLLESNKCANLFEEADEYDRDDIYDLVVFPKALGHVDEAVADLFDLLEKKVTPIPVILEETFKSLSVCRKAGEGRFIGCAQLLLTWFHSHFWKVDRDLQEEDIKWRAPWLLPDEILYRCGNFDWVPLLEIWGAVGYTPLLVLRQYRDDGYRKKIQEVSSAWKQIRRMKRLAVGPMTTLEYNEWWVRRINDNIPKISQKNSQSAEECLRVVPSELEIIRQDFEGRNTELEKKIEQIEEKNMNLRLAIDVQKLKTEKLRKGKNKVEGELDSLKTNYKKLRLTMKTAGLGKTSEQWRAEIREEKVKADRWERRFQEMQM